jgi:DNA primase catalytic core
MYVTKEAIERVRRSLDLVAVVESRGVKLARRGKNFVGLCPFHEDHEPSLVVNPEKQLWHCFGACGSNGGKSGGDVFAFVARADGVTFLEAMKKLGYEEPSAKTPVAKATPVSAPKAAVNGGARCHLLASVAGHYHRVFRERAEGQVYLRTRGLVDPEMLQAFEVGYVDGSLSRTFDAAGEIGRALREIGVLTAKGRELFLGCVVFPLRLPDDGIVGLYGRHTTRDQHLYLPGPRHGVFHWQALKGSSEVILTESVIDALTLYEAGLRNVGAVYGTQGFTADHEELLQRFRVKRVFLCLDTDDAGVQSTRAMGERIGKLGIEVVDAHVAGAKDPNALLQALGPEAAAAALRKAIAEALPLTVNGTVKEKSESAPAAAVSEPSPAGPKVAREDGGGWRVTLGARSYRVRGLSPAGLDRLRVNVRIESGSRMHLDTLDLYGHRARAALVKELARVFEEPEENLAREIATLIETLEGLRLELARQETTTPAAPRLEMPDREREEALRVLRSPDLLDRVLADCERLGCVGERTTLTAGYLGTISRLLDDPLGLIVVSRSGAGKSSVQDLLCDLVPEEDLVRYTRLTGQALFYKEEDALVHKVLAIDEEAGAAEAAYSIRNLQSAQVLTVAATRTDPQTGKLRTEEYRVKGPVFIMFTTTSPEALDYETRNRFVQVGIDESAEQTRRILVRQREADTLEGVLGRAEASFLWKRQQNVQRLLRPLKVVNPYAPSLTYPDERLQMRREQKKYLTLIKAIALLHQHQRDVKHARRGDVEVEYVEVEPRDIALANALARQVLGKSLDELAHPTRQLLKHLVDLTAGQEARRFTRHDVRRRTGWTDWQVRVHLGQLIDLEYVVVAAGRNGQRITYELLFDGDPEEDARYLSGLVDAENLKPHAAQVAGDPGPCEQKGHLVRKTATLRAPCERGSQGRSPVVSVS